MQGYWNKPGGDRAGAARRLDAHRRPRLHGRGRLRLHRRPHEGHDHHRRRERVLRRGRERHRPAPGRGEVRGDRRARRATGASAVHAVVVPRPGATVERTSSSTHCQERIAGYKCPRSVEIVDALPMSGAGKILKRDLRQKYAQSNGIGVGAQRHSRHTDRWTAFASSRSIARARTVQMHDPCRSGRAGAPRGAVGWAPRNRCPLPARSTATDGDRLCQYRFDSITGCPLAPSFFVAVNIPFVWFVLPIAALWCRGRTPGGRDLTGAGLVHHDNALSHIIGARVHPNGSLTETLTAAIIFIPLSGPSTHSARRAESGADADAPASNDDLPNSD